MEIIGINLIILSIFLNKSIKQNYSSIKQLNIKINHTLKQQKKVKSLHTQDLYLYIYIYIYEKYIILFYIYN